MAKLRAYGSSQPPWEEPDGRTVLRALWRQTYELGADRSGGQRGRVRNLADFLALCNINDLITEFRRQEPDHGQ
jgi:hypothetical protein